MAYNSDDVEKFGIRQVDDDFHDSKGFVKPCLTEQDRGEAWDGVFKYFRDGAHDINHFEAECKVQVKGKTVKEARLARKVIKYQVPKNQLKVYLHNGGVLYFVVYVSELNPKKRRTYYCQLLPFDAKNLIQKKEKSKSVSITLKAIPDNWGQKKYIVEIPDILFLKNLLILSNSFFSKQENLYSNLFFNSNSKQPNLTPSYKDLINAIE